MIHALTWHGFAKGETEPRSKFYSAAAQVIAPTLCPVIEVNRLSMLRRGNSGFRPRAVTGRIEVQWPSALVCYPFGGWSANRLSSDPRGDRWSLAPSRREEAPCST